MHRMGKRITTLDIVVSVFVWLILFAQSVSAQSNLIADGFVNDFANVISDEREALLEVQLTEYQKRTMNEIGLVTVPSLEGRDVDSFTVALAKQWGIGQRDKNNGVLFLLAPTERKMRVEVGYGLEHKLTDVEANRIIRDLKKYFRNNDFDGGFKFVVDSIEGQLAEAEPAPETIGAAPSIDYEFWLIVAVCGAFVLVPIVVFVWNASRPRRSYYSPSRGGSSYRSSSRKSRSSDYDSGFIAGSSSGWGGSSGGSSDSGGGSFSGGGDFGGGGSSGDY